MKNKKNENSIKPTNPSNQQYLSAEAKSLALHCLFRQVYGFNPVTNHCSIIYAAKPLFDNFQSYTQYSQLCEDFENHISEKDLEAFRDFTNPDRLKEISTSSYRASFECRTSHPTVDGYSWFEITISKPDQCIANCTCSLDTHILTIMDVSERKIKEREIYEKNINLIHELKETNARILKQSMEDEMTGIYNRKGLNYNAQKLIAEGKARSLYIFSFIADLNGLKYINDSYGHIAGDNAICTIAQILKKISSEKSVLARSGGDEFVLLDIFPADSPVPQKMVSSFKNLIEQLNASKELPYDITASFGTSFVSANSVDDIDQLTKPADSDMYRMKYRLKLNRDGKTDLCGKTSDSSPIEMSAIAATLFNRSPKLIFESMSKVNGSSFFFIRNMKQNTSYWSDNAVEYFGLESNFLHPADLKWEESIHPDDMYSYKKDFYNVFNHISDIHNCVYRKKNAAGEYVWINCKGHMEYDTNGAPEFFSGFVTYLGHRSKIDPITSLHSIHEFRQKLSSALSRKEHGSLLAISIKDFKSVNYTYGYSFGDDVLHNIGLRIDEKLPPSSSVYRLEGPDIVVMSIGGTAETVLSQSEDIRDILAGINVAGECLTLECHFGATLFPEDSDVTDLLQNNLYYAVTDAKESQSKDVVFFSHDIYMKKTYLNRLEKALKDCINNDFKGFRVVYQPIIDGTTGDCISSEALLRWFHPDFPNISPADFVPILESNRDIVTVGNWVLQQSIMTFAQYYKASSKAPEKINVNVSYCQLFCPDFVDFVLSLLAQYQIPHDCLVLELTESCEIDMIDSLLPVLNRLRDEGVCIALDDFGSGYSALSLFSYVPASMIKLAYNMTKSLKTSERAYSLTVSLVTYCHKLGISICAEGIEDTVIYEMIRKTGLDWLQGYLFDKPLEKDDFIKKYIQHV